MTSHFNCLGTQSFWNQKKGIPDQRFGRIKIRTALMRHANSNITMNIYTHAVSTKKRRAQSKVVEMILPEEKAASESAGVA